MSLTSLGTFTVRSLTHSSHLSSNPEQTRSKVCIERLNWCKLVFLSDLDTVPASFVSPSAGHAEIPGIPSTRSSPCVPQPWAWISCFGGEHLHQPSLFVAQPNPVYLGSTRNWSRKILWSGFLWVFPTLHQFSWVHICWWTRARPNKVLKVSLFGQLPLAANVGIIKFCPGHLRYFLLAKCYLVGRPLGHIFRF